MNNISNYILEKLHIDKDSKYLPPIKVGDDALWITFNVYKTYNLLAGYYVNITELKNDLIASKICDAGFSNKLNHSGFEPNSHHIYERNNSPTSHGSIIYLDPHNAISFLQDLIDNDYKFNKDDLGKYFDNQDILNSTNEIDLSNTLKDKAEEYLDNFKTFEDE